ncbi:ankyrin repeat and SOCS box protein 13 isoform X3 [Lampetra fluviatilis]
MMTCPRHRGYGKLRGHFLKSWSSAITTGFWADRSPLHEAASLGRALQVKRLIETGACVNLVTVDSVTPLHEACQNGHALCTQMLLSAGAQVEARNIDGSTPLCEACASGSLECVRLLLLHGARVNLSIFTVSPLHEACLGGSVECVQLLIAAGAHLEAHDCHLGTPLHVATYKQHQTCVRALLDAGANVNAAKLHETALHHAARTHDAALLELLVEFGARVNARDNRGRRPSDYLPAGSPCWAQLARYERHPSPLLQLCRLAVRGFLGPQRLHQLPQLPLPRPLRQFLAYS